MKGIAAALAAAVLAGSTPAWAADPQKIDISLEMGGKDDFASTLVFYTREKFQGSPSFSISNPSAIGYHIQIQAIEVKGAQAHSYSAVLTFKDTTHPTLFEDAYINSIIGVCSDGLAATCAENIFAFLGGEMTATRDELSAAFERGSKAVNRLEPKAH